MGRPSPGSPPVDAQAHKDPLEMKTFTLWESAPKKKKKKERTLHLGVYKMKKKEKKTISFFKFL